MREGLLGDRVGCRKCLLGGGGGASSWRRREVRPGCGSASFPADFPTPLPTRVWSRLLLPLDLQPIGWAEAQPLGSSAGAPVPWRAVSPRVASRLLVLHQRHCLPARPSLGALAPEFLGLVYLRVLVSGARFSVTADQVFTGPYQPRVAKVPLPGQGRLVRTRLSILHHVHLMPKVPYCANTHSTPAAHQALFGCLGLSSC